MACRVEGGASCTLEHATASPSITPSAQFAPSAGLFESDSILCTRGASLVLVSSASFLSSTDDLVEEGKNLDDRRADNAPHAVHDFG